MYNYIDNIIVSTADQWDALSWQWRKRKDVQNIQLLIAEDRFDVMEFEGHQRHGWTGLPMDKVIDVFGFVIKYPNIKCSYDLTDNVDIQQQVVLTVYLAREEGYTAPLSPPVSFN